MTDFPPLTFDPDALDPEASVLLPRLSDGDPVVRRIALLELADLEDENLLPPIVDALRHDNSADVRREAARVLAAWEREEVVDALCGALLDRDEAVRLAAAQSLSELKDATSGKVLLRWVARTEPFVQVAVLRALRELRLADAFDPALRALSHSLATVRLEAVGVLGWLKDPRALAQLASVAAGDADPDVRRAAVGALGLCPEPTTPIVDALLSALRDDAWQVREEAATTLGKLRAPGSGEALVVSLDDPYWQVRLTAARALGRLRDAAAGPALAVLLSHAISNLRKEAALALGELGDSGALPALLAAQGDADPEVRKAIRIALQQIGGHPA
ncbi:HEAT repeat domain-containing protein [Paraburkholderia sartisoli]|uniref:HEAT repeat n=1 Tax=Paraburkholderia sartisoli TaxID=83784 RepID=A0A1H4DYS8_9BURK|nr:HEAT repeat domain-containing protein [Paraburkholderia sartisoli]SEA77649.1 HEAT repeat [Paraburkholderia sartisoli]